ncbi:MAG: sulfotransferase [Deltaproteobacteria bacterium]|nr:sulfotransferase [Deltaproteobacteria bacterium]
MSLSVELLPEARMWMTLAKSNLPVVFVTGVPRSGTTLLKSVLVTHSAFGGTDGESTGLFKLRKLGEFRLGEVPKDVMRSAYSSSNDIIDFYERVAGAVLDVRKKRRFVDKVFPSRLRYEFVVRHFPASLFLNITRDARDCFCSAKHHPNVPQAKSAEIFATYWMRSLALISKLPAARRFDLTFEELTTEPTETITRLMSFLGEPFEEKQIEVSGYSATTSIKKREVHQNLGKEIAPRSVGRWKKELSAEDRETFERIAGRKLRELGYGV